MGSRRFIYRRRRSQVPWARISMFCNKVDLPGGQATLPRGHKINPRGQGGHLAVIGVNNQP